MSGRRFAIATEVDGGRRVRLAVYGDAGALLGDAVLAGETAIDLGHQLVGYGLTALRRAREASRVAAAPGVAQDRADDSGRPPARLQRGAIRRALRERRGAFPLAGVPD